MRTGAKGAAKKLEAQKDALEDVWTRLGETLFMASRESGTLGKALCLPPFKNPDLWRNLLDQSGGLEFLKNSTPELVTQWVGFALRWLPGRALNERHFEWLAS